MALVQNESDIAANELTLRQVSSPFAESTVRPNNAFQLTPLRGPKIVGILVTDFVLTLVLTYGCGAAERWALGRTEDTSQMSQRSEKVSTEIRLMKERAPWPST